MIPNSFWKWYERHYRINVGLAAFLFLWQLVHLYWLTTDVVAGRLFGESFFEPSEFWRILLILVDYTEIPAIVATSLVYINELRKDRNLKSFLLLFFINSQWLHILWITDEFVIKTFVGDQQLGFPVWLAWLAIGIDYLELPVIYDTIKKFFRPPVDIQPG
ncbi:MAG: hypothetical protein Q8R08_00440 [bacterium]|nr:hypothetical protein [bacterium]